MIRPIISSITFSTFITCTCYLQYCARTFQGLPSVRLWTWINLIVVNFAVVKWTHRDSSTRWVQDDDTIKYTRIHHQSTVFNLVWYFIACQSWYAARNKTHQNTSCSIRIEAWYVKTTAIAPVNLLSSSWITSGKNLPNYRPESNWNLKVSLKIVLGRIFLLICCNRIATARWRWNKEIANIRQYT
jgi:hypothetical protein